LVRCRSTSLDPFYAVFRSLALSSFVRSFVCLLTRSLSNAIATSQWRSPHNIRPVLSMNVGSLLTISYKLPLASSPSSASQGARLGLHYTVSREPHAITLRSTFLSTHFDALDSLAILPTTECWHRRVLSLGMVTQPVSFPYLLILVCGYCVTMKEKKWLGRSPRSEIRAVPALRH
jgi:hypothetical protein